MLGNIEAESRLSSFEFPFSLRHRPFFFDDTPLLILDHLPTQVVGQIATKDKVSFWHMTNLLSGYIMRCVPDTIYLLG